MKIFPETTNSLKKLLNFIVTRNLNGEKLKIPCIHGIKVGVGNEKWMSEVLEKLTKITKGNVFWDVGANLGQSLVKLKTVDDPWAYVGFEPNPTCVFYLHDLVNKNLFSDTTILPVGLHIEDTLLQLETYGDDADPLGSIVCNFRESLTIHEKNGFPCSHIPHCLSLLSLKKLISLKLMQKVPNLMFCPHWNLLFKWTDLTF